ncbi:MAG: DUF4338 domain-containing protein [Polyangiaceae bacterium]|nr:DUF4338 domain-containing protein [Polyangiaceae bacterium]
MEPVLTFRGREISTEDVAFIREFVASRPEASRWALSRELCQAWGWVQENGALRDQLCRSLMLSLHRGGYIELPLPRRQPRNPLAHRPTPAPVVVDETPIVTSLGSLGPLTFSQVHGSPEELLWNGLVQMHHYLGYTQPVGEQLKYLVRAGERPVACVSFSSAPRHLGPRDRHLGWSAESRRRNIRFVAYHSRYLIMPWVRVPHMASHVLGRLTRGLSADWKRTYGHPVYFVETFVDPSRYRGTCYYAANWVHLGQTTGRGKDDHTNRPNRPIKDVLGYPLTKHFRELLSRAA